MYKFVSFFLLIFLFSFANLESVIVADMVEVRLSIEDGDAQAGIVKDVKFNGDTIDISKKSFMNRRIQTIFKVAPGQYEIDWVVEKKETPWKTKEVKNAKRIIQFELTDAIVYIHIRGENLTTY